MVFVEECGKSAGISLTNDGLGVSLRCNHVSSRATTVSVGKDVVFFKCALCIGTMAANLAFAVFPPIVTAILGQINFWISF